MGAGIVWTVIGVAVILMGRWQRACALGELRHDRPTNYPLGARHQLIGAWVLLVLGGMFVWAGVLRIVGVT